MPGAVPRHRILKKSADALGTLMLGHESDIFSVERDAAGIGYKAAGDGIEKC